MSRWPMVQVTDRSAYPQLSRSTPIFQRLIVRQLNLAELTLDTRAAAYWRGFAYEHVLQESLEAWDRG